MHGGPWYILTCTPIEGDTFVWSDGATWQPEAWAPPKLFRTQGQAALARGACKLLRPYTPGQAVPRDLYDIRPVLVIDKGHPLLNPPSPPPRPSPLARLRAWWAAWSPYI